MNDELLTETHESFIEIFKKNMIDKVKILNNPNTQVFIYLSIYLLNQIRLILKGGTTWDDLALVETTPRIIHKFELFFTDSNNPFLSEFVSNFEFYGYLVLIPTYLFSNNSFVVSSLSYVFNNLLSINLINTKDLEYILRHIFLNFYLVFSLFFIYKLYSKMSDKQRGLKFIILLSFMPIVSGHSLFNLKDIPFMIQNLFVALFFIKYLLKFEESNFYDQFNLGLFFGFLFLVRFNGIAFLFIYYLFSFLYLDKNYITIKRNIINWIKITLTSLIVLFIGTPSSWQKPKLWIEKTIETQFTLYWDSYVLTNGKFIFALDVDPFYLLTWFYFKLPIIFHISLIISLFLIMKNLILKNTNFEVFFIFSLYFIFFIFSSFMILRPVAYDGVRQYLFIIPFFVFIVVECLNSINLSKYKSLSTFLVIILYLSLTQAGLGPYKYVYFNEFTNIESITLDCDDVGGCGDWQTDYWGYSGKELINNINNDFEGSLYICSPSHVFSTYLNNDKVKIISNDGSERIDILNNHDGEFYLAYLHRPMLLNDTCGFKKSSIDVVCEDFVVQKTKLRSEIINLSYIDKCIKN